MRRYKGYSIIKLTTHYKARADNGLFLLKSFLTIEEAKSEINIHINLMPKRPIGELVLSMRGCLSFLEHTNLLDDPLVLRIKKDLSDWLLYKEYLDKAIPLMESNPIFEFNTTSKQVIKDWLLIGQDHESDLSMILEHGLT